MEGMLPGLFEGGKGWGTCVIVWGVLGDMCDCLGGVGGHV